MPTIAETVAATTANRNEELHKHVNDLIALEDHILEAVERQLDWEEIQRRPEAQQRLALTLAVLRTHKANLEGYLTSRGESSSMLKLAVTTVTGIAAGLYGKVREHTAARILRDDYTALNLASVSTAMLYTTALAYGEQPLADVASQHYQELARLIVGLSDVLPEVVVAEIEAVEPGRATSAVEATHKLHRRVWDAVVEAC